MTDEKPPRTVGDGPTRRSPSRNPQTSPPDYHARGARPVDVLGIPTTTRSTTAGSLTVTPALVDEGAQAGGEPIGIG